jgi:hypothetical protein
MRKYGYLDRVLKYLLWGHSRQAQRNLKNIVF